MPVPFIVHKFHASHRSAQGRNATGDEFVDILPLEVAGKNFRRIVVEDGIDAQLGGRGVGGIVRSVRGYPDDSDMLRVGRIDDRPIEGRSAVTVVPLRGEAPAHFRRTGPAAKDALSLTTLEPFLLLPGVVSHVGANRVDETVSEYYHDCLIRSSVDSTTLFPGSGLR